MALGKRKRVSSKRAYRTSVRVGNSASLARASRARLRPRSTQAYMVQRLSSQIQRINRSIETKEGQWTSANDISIAHNELTIIQHSAGGVLNPFQSLQGVTDPMESNNFIRIGDSIHVKGLLIKAFVEGALQRSKVYFRIMLVKSARGDTPTRATLFKGDSPNKMLDQVNTERFTIVWQKIFNVSPPNSPPNAVSVGTSGLARPGDLVGVTGNRIIKAWIPGAKFGRGGVLQYENGSGTNLKFYDYRLCVLCYDWYGTPQDINNVGKINSLFTKVYFKDA